MKIAIDAPVLCLRCKGPLSHQITSGVVYIEQCRNCGPFETLIKQFCLKCVHRYSNQDCCNNFDEIDYIRGAFLRCVGKYYEDEK